MKPIVAFILAFLVTPFKPVCQPVDIMVKNVFYHEVLENGTQTGNKYISIQKTYDNSNRLVLERFYSDTAKRQVGYRWYFYDDRGRVKSIEDYSMDRRPVQLIQVLYNEKGDTLKIINHAGNRDGITKTSEKSFVYAPSGLLRQTRTLSPSGNVIETAKYTYKRGIKSPVKKTVTNHSAFPFREKATYACNDSTGLPMSAVRQVRDLKSGSRYTVSVSYNSRGNATEELYVEAGKPFRKKCFEYAAGLELEKYYEEDGSGKLTLLTTIETYWHKANLNMKSYFE